MYLEPANPTQYHSINAVVIKDKKTGQYYAGCNKALAQTLLGAQLYKSAKTAEGVIKKSVNFHISDPIIVEVVLHEIEG